MALLTHFPEMEPMPDIPALPPDAPSFSERLSSDRPRTAPPKTQAQAPSQASPRGGPYEANSSRKVGGRVPPPPLPLRLRPPLRKKKSFSRVSSWLFLPNNGDHQHLHHPHPHNRDISLDSITNLPRPVTGADGFYQVAPAPRRSSCDTVSSAGSDWSPDAPASAPPPGAAFDRRILQRDLVPRPPPGRIVGVAF